MRAIRVFLSRVVGLIRGRRLDRDLQDEIAAHIMEAADEYRRQGLSAADARRAALRGFGGVTQAREAYREARSFGWADDAWNDLRYALRTFSRAPGFASVVVLTLALGIGVNTALLSVVREVLLKTLPVSHPEELVEIDCSSQLETTGVGVPCMRSYPAFRLLSERHPGLSGLAAFGPVPNGLVASSRGTREVITGQLASANLFDVLGISAIVGRLLQDADDRPGAPTVGVLSHGYWLRHFGGTGDVVGQSLVLNGHAVTIVGVLPRAYRGVTFGEPYDVVLPIRLATLLVSARPAPGGAPGTDILNDPGRGWLTFLARRRNDLPNEEIERQLTPVFTESTNATLAGIPAETRKRLNLTFVGLHVTLSPAALGASSNMRSNLEPTLRVLLVVSVLVLLIACANIAGLFLSQAINRQKEFGVRFALGAGRSRLLRQVFAESLTFAALGGGLGLLLAQWVGPIGFSLATDDTGLRAIDLAPDRWMLASALSLSVLAGLIVAAVSVLRISSANPHDALRQVRAPGSPRLTKTLLTAQIALTVTLVGGASLLVQTLANFHRIDVGFQPKLLTTVKMDAGFGALDAPRARAYIEWSSAALGALPGVTAVTHVNRAIGTGVPMFLAVDVPEFTGAGADAKSSGLLYAGPAFVRAIGLTLLAGRDIEPTDRTDSPRVAVVNQSFATHFFGKLDVVGRTFGFDGPITIVGVVKDARDTGVKGSTERMMYLPYAQGDEKSLTFTIRSAQSGLQISEAARRTLERLEPAVGVEKVGTVQAQLDDAIRRERLLAVLAATFSGLALLLTAIGLYGMLNAMVLRRRVEIGVRVALGASRGHITWMLAHQTFVLVAAGLGLGAAGYAGAGRLIQRQLFQITASDPKTIGSTVMVLLAVAVAAVWLPTVRATRISATEALRHEDS